jgi:very-short-patch-repair endonuclease/muramidase (phage lysozyme)
MPPKLNTEEFIKKAKKIHGDKYNYSLVNYVNNKTNIIIVCKIDDHCEFLQTPSNHLRGAGCSKCSGCYQYTTKEWIKKAKKIHGDKYDYSLVDYVNNNTNVIIICNVDKHGEFLKMPVNHLSGSGCSKCFGCYQYTTKEWIKKAREIHGDKYDYSLVNYINTYTNVIIICKVDEHGDFLQIPSCHLNGSGCIKCSGRYQYTTEEWIKKAKNIHGNKYDYSKVIYVKTNEKVIIICKKHGTFTQTPANHLQGIGCPFCINKTEGILYKKLQPYYPSLQIQFSPEWIGKKRFDFCIPEHNIIIELDGPQHFEQVNNWCSPEEQQRNDKEKEKLANDNNHCVIRLLQEDVFYNTYDWLGELLENIQTLINEKPIIQNIYMDKNNEYEIYL